MVFRTIEGREDLFRDFLILKRQQNAQEFPEAIFATTSRKKHEILIFAGMTVQGTVKS